MDITAVCTRLLIDVLILLVAQIGHSYSSKKADAVFPSVSPNRLQFYEYENFTVNCEEFTGLTEWRVMNLQSAVCDPWTSSASSCSINPSFKRHSGAYWCEDAEGRTSRAVSITVTAGSVILDVPARPVVQGHDVVLHCSKKESKSEHTATAEFYKDGSSLGSQYKGTMTIQKVSTSDEGLYRCKIPGAGESPESRLTVSNQSKEAPKETPPSSSPSSYLLSLLWMVVCMLLGGLLLLVMGLLLCRKHKVLICFSSGKPTPGSHSHEDHTVSGENSVVDPQHATYAFVKKQGKKVVGVDAVDNPQHATYALVQKVAGADSVVDPQHATYALVQQQKKEKGEKAVDPDDVTYAAVKHQRKKKGSARTKASSPEESVIYSSVYQRPLAPD